MEYAAPDTLAQALAARAAGARPVAGGTDLYPALAGAVAPGPLVDLSGVEGLSGITRLADGGWRIGAATTWSEIAAAGLPGAFAALQQAAREVGAVQIQNAGTIGGNLVNASPAADGVPPLLVLGARVELAAAGGVRQMPLGAFLTGPRQTALAADELLVAIHLPPPPPGAGTGFVKLGSRRFLVISFVMVAAMVEHDGAAIRAARVAVGACSPVALRLEALEAELIGQPLEALRAPGLVTPGHLAPLSPIDDMRADAGYRRAVAGPLIVDALRQAAQAAQAAGGQG